MQVRPSSLSSPVVDHALVAGLVAVSMFAVGYTAARVYLFQPVESPVVESPVIPHQASLWSALGR